MTIKYIKCALHVGYYKQALRICNNYRSSLATLIARTRLNVTLYVHCFSLFLALSENLIKKLTVVNDE